FTPYFIVYNILYDVIGYSLGDGDQLTPLIRAALSYMYFAYYLVRNRPRIVGVLILPVVIVSYTTILVLLSSEVQTTLRVHLRVAIFFIYAIVCYDYIKKYPNMLRSMVLKLPYVLLTYILYTALANVVDLGSLY